MRLFLGSICLVALLAFPAGATVVFNDLSSNGTIPTSIGGFGGVQVQGSAFGGPNLVVAATAAQFTPSQNFTLTEIDIVIGNNGGPGDANVLLQLFTDSGGLPGVAVSGASWNIVGSGDISTVTKVTVSGVQITAGTPYWLVANPGDAHTTALWSLNTLVPSFQGLHAISSLPLQGWTILNGPSNFFDVAFAVQGNVTPAPEPATLALAGTALGLLLARRRLR